MLLKNQKDRGYSDPSVVDDVMQAYLSSWLRFVYGFDISEFPRSDTDRNAWNAYTQPRVALRLMVCITAAQNTIALLSSILRSLTLTPLHYDSLATWGRDMFGDPQGSNPPWETWILEEGAGQVSLNISGDENPSPAPANFMLTAEIEGAGLRAYARRDLH